MCVHFRGYRLFNGTGPIEKSETPISSTGRVPPAKSLRKGPPSVPDHFAIAASMTYQSVISNVICTNAFYICEMRSKEGTKNMSNTMYIIKNTYHKLSL